MTVLLLLWKLCFPRVYSCVVVLSCLFSSLLITVFPKKFLKFNTTFQRAWGRQFASSLFIPESLSEYPLSFPSSALYSTARSRLRASRRRNPLSSFRVGVCILSLRFLTFSLFVLQYLAERRQRSNLVYFTFCMFISFEVSNSFAWV